MGRERKADAILSILHCPLIPDGRPTRTTCERCCFYNGLEYINKIREQQVIAVMNCGFSKKTEE